jgi:hypothetical protein
MPDVNGNPTNDELVATAQEQLRAQAQEFHLQVQAIREMGNERSQGFQSRADTFVEVAGSKADEIL